MITSEKRVIAPCAPTGFGKSGVYVAAALLSGKATCVVTDSRGLQDQLLDEFQGIGMVDIRGRRNYPCDMKEDYTCEEGYAAQCPYKGTIACPSSQAEMRAATSRLVVTNYDKWTSSRKYGQGMSHFEQVIFDEGHAAPDAVARAMQVVMNHKEIEETLKVDFPHGDREKMETWKQWAIGVRAITELAMRDAYSKIVGRADAKPSWVRHYTHMKNLNKRMGIIACARPTDWVVDEIDTGYVFDPIRPGRYAECTLLLKIPKIIIVSATLRPKTLFMLGLGKDTFDFVEFNSSFDPKRCPIYYIPVMRVDSRAEDLTPLWIKHDQIAARRRDRKGIVQTVSYLRQQEVLNSSRFWESMILNEKGSPPTETIEKFRSLDPSTGAILVSPSVHTGYDFKMDECEWQLMCKIPFEPPSKVVKAREQDDPEYRGYRAMQYMVQAFGRPMRSKEDRVENFICDEHLQWFLPRYAHLAPKSFHNFFQRVSLVPPPAPKL